MDPTEKPKKVKHLSGQIEVTVSYVTCTTHGAPYCEFAPDKELNHELSGVISGYEVADSGYPESYPTYKHDIIYRG